MHGKGLYMVAKFYSGVIIGHQMGLRISWYPQFRSLVSYTGSLIPGALKRLSVNTQIGPNRIN